MSVRRPPFVLLAFLAGTLLGLSCRVAFDDKLAYSCKTDSDCAGDGYVCAIGPTRAVCCKPTGTEVCDKVDNDCDGLVDNTGKTEICNGEDDDCNGATDEGFNLRADDKNCGACGRECMAHFYCRNGNCTEKVEAVCYDMFDDDNNGLTDCADPSCDLRTCGNGCTCRSRVNSEDGCSDHADNDRDQAIDCADDDCVGKACAAGCTCVPDGGQIETDCTDAIDNDLDSRTDCVDPDCVGRFCTPPEIYFQCTAGMQCKCNGSVQVAEVGSVLCRDGVDNDCNGKKDCQETTCDTQSCAADGGMDCTCANNGKKEANCANLLDDDEDGKIDCADTDCAQGTSCSKPDGGGAGMCNASRTCD